MSGPGAMPDYYAVLGVAPDASSETIRRAYRALARRVHPDVCADRDAAERFAAVARAYEVLADAEARTRYDLARVRASVRTVPGGRPFDEERVDAYDVFRSKRGVGFGRARPGGPDGPIEGG